ncbi:MAG: HD domain-containing protein [Candidatus Dadabacteria bacterium]|nr:HD domain-containing protein [Candidatus Dadabacteria bacterium]NIQ14409.1 HD domain-containing protein [Candidatus Dadabacteria bacterium]
MDKKLKFEKNSFKVALRIVNKLKAEGYKAFLVGGCVRDAILGLEPEEIDITTDAKPHEVKELFKRTVSIGESFGVVLVLEEDKSFEIATFRSEDTYSDGRHPEKVVYSDSEEEDVLRRDFTINGMLYDPILEKTFDYVEGMQDLNAGVIKTIGEPYKRFEEDKLRMIRAIRFAARYSFEIEKNTYLAVKSLAPKINIISVERIRDEIVKIITNKNPGEGLKLLLNSGLLVHILPEVEAMNEVKQPPEFHPEGDVFVHTCLVLEYLYKNTNGEYSPEVAMGALLHDIGKPPTYKELDRIRFNGHDRVGAKMSKEVCRRLKFSNKQIERIVCLVRDHLKFKDVFNMRESTLKRFLSMPYFDEHLEMHLADCLASHGMVDAYNFIKNKLLEYSKEEIKPDPLIGGNDLIKIGYEPGPLFKDILENVENLQLENKLNTKEQAVEYVLENYPKRN